MSDRREFLKFLAGSPLLLASPALLEAFTQAPTAQAAAATLASAADALDVYDFEAMARKVLPPAHWGYLATGVDGEETLRANPRGFDRYHVAHAPVRRREPHRHGDGALRADVHVARRAVSRRQSAGVPCRKASWPWRAPPRREGSCRFSRRNRPRRSRTSLKARGGSGLWYQLYTTNNWDVTTKLLKRAEAAGCPVVAVTVDLPGGRNTETDQRMARIDTRVCADCHGVPGPAS